MLICFDGQTKTAYASGTSLLTVPETVTTTSTQFSTVAATGTTTVTTTSTATHKYHITKTITFDYYHTFVKYTTTVTQPVTSVTFYKTSSILHTVFP
jgi:hypothetical protein